MESNQFCAATKNALEGSRQFKVVDVSTISGFVGNTATIEINVPIEGKNKKVRANVALYGDSAAYLYRGEYNHLPKNESRSIKMEIFCEGETYLKDVSQKIIHSATDLIASHAKRFEALRIQAAAQKKSTFYTPADSVIPEIILVLLSFFITSMVRGELSEDKTVIHKPLEEVGNDNLKRRIFANVGIQVINDPRDKKTYVAIYGHKDDYVKGNHPKFFAAFDDSLEQQGVSFFVKNLNNFFDSINHQDQNNFYIK